ncbi:RCC1 domain-containing protein [Paenibacillus plantarum]|nr:S-layer homology domain-containing protein [Paenibacillus plantarum]
MSIFNKYLQQKSIKGIFPKLLIIALLVSIIQPMLLAPSYVSADTEPSVQGVYSFGSNGNGKLGNGGGSNESSPRQLEGLANISGIAAGNDHSLVLTTDGDVYSFGNNYRGPLGQSSNNVQSTPKMIANLPKAKAVAAGQYHSLVLTVTGDVYSFGGDGGDYFNFGQLGHGDRSAKLTPTKIEGLPEVSAIAAGRDHSLVLTVTGEVYSFGYGGFGQLGHGNWSNQLSPKKIDALNNVTVKAIAAGGDHSLVLTRDGEVYSFGQGAAGQLGLGVTSTQTTPVKINSLPPIQAIAAGATHSLVLTTDGKVYSFGGTYYNWSPNEPNSGQLGHGDTNNLSSPTKIDALNDETVTAITAGGYHSLVLTTNGEVYSFGAGGTGQLGLGNYVDQLSPTKMPFPRRVTAIDAGVDYTLMLSTIDSRISPSYTSFDKYVQHQDHTDQTINLQLNGNPFTGITNGTYTLQVGDDYTVDGSTVTIKKEYLNTLEVDTSTTLTFSFSSSASQDLSIYISDSRPNNANLTDLQVDGTTVTGFASGKTGPYEVSIPYAQTTSTITYTLSDPDATVDVAGNTNLSVGENTVEVTVTAQKGNTKVYTITVTRAAAPIDTGGGGDSGSGGTAGGSGTAGNSGAASTTPITSTDGKMTLPVGRDGEVKLGEEAAVSIPSGAMDQPTTITIEKVKDIAGLEQQGIVLASPVYELSKDVPGSFKEPVTLTFQFDASKVSEAQHASIYYFDENQQRWIELGGKVSGNTITVEVDHFAKFTVLVVDNQKIEVTFSDIAGHWAEALIHQAVSRGIVTGYSDGTFKPNATITRAEFTVMLMNALKPLGDGAPLSFSDSTLIGAWAQRAVAQSVAAGIVAGYNDGTFRPTANITRSELASMIARAYGAGLATVDSTGFADDRDIPAWAKPAILAVREAGIVEGIGNNVFAPSATATRAEAITMIINLLKAK